MPESESKSKSLSDTLSSSSSGGVTIPLYIANDMPAIYMMNIKTSNKPPILTKGMERSTYTASSEVKLKRTTVYIFELRSKYMSVGEKIKPRLKAPRTLEMDDPSTATN